MKRFHPTALLASSLALALSPCASLAAEPSPTPPPAAPAAPIATIPQVLQDLRAFGELGSVLYVAAHPDDENTQLITYLARGRLYRTAYLSVTRGDGGQNESGPEFGEKLGLARTHELLAARQLDGGHQFFTRALDFGFSKDVNETLRIWDRQQVLADVVRVIRTFRPDVVVTRFSPIPGGTHGHHTASAVLALEAFKLAGDPTAFPEQLTTLTPWQPKRIFQNFSPWSPKPANVPGLTIESGGNDAVTGESFGSIAARSRGMHITQGFGNFAAGAATSGPRPETFALLEGAPATTDLLEGIDTTWSRYPQGAEIARLTTEALSSFNAENPSASVGALLEIRRRLASFPADPVIDDKRGQLDRLLASCLGLKVETFVPDAEVVPGETLALTHRVTVAASLPVRWVSVRFPGLKSEVAVDRALAAGQPSTLESAPVLPASTAPTQPYWLREDTLPGMFQVKDASLIGRPVNPPEFPVDCVFEISGQTFVVSSEPVQRVEGAPPAQALRPLAVIAPVSIAFDAGVELFKPGSSKTLSVELTAARAGTSGVLRLETTQGWTVAPAAQTFALKQVGEKARFSFTITSTAAAGEAELLASAKVGGVTYDRQRLAIRYPHVPVLLLQPPSHLKLVSLPLEHRGTRVGYLPGAGDNTAESLAQIGYTVVPLTGADLTLEKLHGLDAVVIGVRAFNERKDLEANLPGLFAYAEAGGTVIAQYNRPNGLKTKQLAPYALSIAGDAPKFRVTDENAPVTFLAPDHPALTTPNALTQADFEGWVQERGAYFPSSWDETKFTPLLAMNDPGEAPLKSSLLVAKCGKGYFIYTGVAFFRQLPAGVPGAYRLFANLVSLGK